MNRINKAPLMAFGLGLGLMLSVVTMSSFKAESNLTTRYYFYDNDGAGPNAPAWHTTAPAAELDLACETAPPKLCSADFPSAPTSSDNLIINNGSSTNRTSGNYE